MARDDDRRSTRDDDDDRPRRSARDDDPPRRSSSRDDDDAPPRRSSSRDDDDAPRRRSSRDDDDDAPRRRSSRDDDDGPRFKYRSRGNEAVQKRAEGGGDFDTWIQEDVKVYKAPPGNNNVRFLPPTWDGAEHFGYDVWLHYNVGSDKGTYLCLDKMKGKPCPVCEERALATRSGDEEYAKELRPNHRVASFIIDREKPRDGVQVYGVGKRMDQDIMRLCIDKRSGESLEIDHPEKGYDFSFERDGEGTKTRYTALAIDRRPSPLDNDKALKFAVEHPLPTLLRYYSYEHIAKAFAGKAKPDDDDAPKKRSRDDDDDPPPKRREPRKEVDLTWDEVHELSFRKLEALVDDHRLKIDPQSTRSDDELADAICEELGIEKKAVKRSSRDDDDDPPPRREAKKDDDEDSPRVKLRKMRDE